MQFFPGLWGEVEWWSFHFRHRHSESVIMRLQLLIEIENFSRDILDTFFLLFRRKSPTPPVIWRKRMLPYSQRDHSSKTREWRALEIFHTVPRGRSPTPSYMLRYKDYWDHEDQLSTQNVPYLLVANCIARQDGGQCPIKLTGTTIFFITSASLTSRLVHKVSPEIEPRYINCFNDDLPKVRNRT